MFEFDMTQPPEGLKQKKEFEPLTTGEYTGTIEDTEIKVSKAGQKYISVKIKLDNKRVLFDRISMEAQNETAKKIAFEKFQSICFFGIEKPEGKFKNLEDMASYIKGTPVKVYYTYKGKDERGYTMESIHYKPGQTKINKTQVVTPKTLY